MTRRRYRLLKWVGLFGCVLLPLLATAGWLWERHSFYPPTVSNGPVLECGKYRVFLDFGWTFRARCFDTTPFRWSSGLTMGSMNEVGSLTIPLWIPFVALALPTAWFWYLDRRRPAPGKCRCGYDLTGNTSGRCPECGQLVEKFA